MDPVSLMPGDPALREAGTRIGETHACRANEEVRDSPEEQEAEGRARARVTLRFITCTTIVQWRGADPSWLEASVTLVPHRFHRKLAQIADAAASFISRVVLFSDSKLGRRGSGTTGAQPSRV